MANRLAETGLPWDPNDIDATSARDALHQRPKVVVRRGRVVWSSEGSTWRANIGRWSAQVTRDGAEPPAWEWRAFATLGVRPRAVGAGSWSAVEDAKLDAERTLAELY